MEYGLIGRRLGHSYSKIIHEMLCGYAYDLCPLEPEQLEELFAKREFKALNVTIPYKQAVIPLLDEVDEGALAIGAVNTVVNREGRLYGYNTDLAGFEYLARAHGCSMEGKTVLVLGTGGTSRTVCAAARRAGAAEVLRAGRTGADGALTYEQAAARRDVQVIVNTTPAGMFPDNGGCMVQMEWFPACEAVFDVVYNPFCTELVLRARDAGIPAAGGFEMLVAQAVYAARQFTGRDIPESEIARVHGILKAKLSNLSLVGMPSCGKSSLGKALAARLGKTFVDLDDEIEQEAGMPIPEIFAQKGEAGFREIESEVCRRFGAKNGQVLSTGGGAVLRKENVRALRQNGPVVHIDRPLDQLAVGGKRPLSKSRGALEEMLRVRGPLYRAAAHRTVSNTGTFEETARAIEEAFYEISGTQRPEPEPAGRA